MEPLDLTQRFVRFGPFELDLHTGELTKDNRRLRLPQQPFQILTLLLSRPNDLVTRQELIERLWPDGVVVDYEHSLNKAVRKLREVLDEQGGKASCIETLSKRGYRFVLTVEDSDATESSRAASHKPVQRRVHSRRFAWGAAILVTAFVAAGSHVWMSRGASEPPGFEKLVILPFLNLSGDPGQEFFSDALTEEMIAQIGDMDPERLGVIARTTAMQYKATKKTAREIGRELDVEYILESSFQRAGTRARITTQLIDARADTHLWSQSYDLELRDLLTVRQNVARNIARSIRLQLSGRQAARLSLARPIDSKAYELYLTGMYHMEREWSSSSYELASRYFESAIVADPFFAPPYAALANVYVELRLWGRLSDQEARAKAKWAAERAVELDSEMPEGHAALGNVRFMLEWDWEGAGEDFRRATEFHLTRLTGLRKYVRFLMLTGRTDEGVALHERMIELDPLSTDLRIVYGWTLKYARRYDEGVRYLQQMLAEEPDLPAIAHYHLAWNLAMSGRYAEAATECQEIDDAQSCAYVYAMWGRRAEALAFAAKNEVDDPVFTAASYAALGNRQRALQLLERGYRERLPTMVYVWAAPELQPLHNDPDFKDLIRRMGFPANRPGT